MTARRLRVLHVVGNLELGGGQKLTALVAAGLDPERFDVTVLNLGRRGPYDDYLAVHRIPVIDLGLPMRPRLTELPGVIRGLARLVGVLFGRPRWDIVHTHMFRTSLLCAIPARLAGARLFGTVHRIYFRWQPVIERLFAPLHEALVVDSAAIGRILRARTHIREDKYVVIHDGIDPAEFEEAPSRAEARQALGLPESSVVVTEIASLMPHKGQTHLITAFARLRGADLRLMLVGDGPDRDRLQRLATDLGVSGATTILGARRDLPLLLKATDILVLPSRFEGFGIVMAEGMYLGLPVIGTDRGGATEVIVDGVTGYLVPFGDVESLTDRLQRFTASRSLRQRFGEAGHLRVVEHFTQPVMAARYEALYAGALTRGLAGADDADGAARPAN